MTRPANRLAGQTSPYLLQHAHNPVDWFPWGPEAFEEARRRGVPIFLSVGYSTCYWCHVMERECFENEAIGRLMSGLFVCVKVDREERPDVDDVYMAAVQVMSGSGGWPMSLWLTPPGAAGPGDGGLRPFYAGTYFPPEDRFGRPGLSRVMRSLSDAWANQREQVLAQAADVAGAVGEQLAQQWAPVRADERHISQAVGRLLRIHDGERGGFGGAPKFPQPVYLEFLLDARPVVDDPAAQASIDRAVRTTLDQMAIGGMNDQLGGGFHRYSVDASWTVPHFEKMLYDNAQLARVYARSARLNGDDYHAQVARRTLDYVLGEMTDPAGGFHSAQDAEVDAREGLNYLWTREDLAAALPPDDSALAARVFGLDRGPNFRDPHHPQEPARSVLRLRGRPEAVAAGEGLTGEDFEARMGRVRAALLAVRARRKQPGLDDKVLASWNGLMIASLADAAGLLNEPRYLDAAERAARFVLSAMRGPGGELLRTWRRGRAHTEGFAEDYAAVVLGLVAVQRAGGAMGRSSPEFASAALDLIDRAVMLFGDPAAPGALFDTPPGRTDLIVRTRGTYDGAMPSAGSVLAHALIDLFELTGDRRVLSRAVSLVGTLTHAVDVSPVGSINATRAVLRLMLLDRSIPDAWGPAGAEAPPAEAPVQVFTTVERVAVGAAEAEIPLKLRIAPGYHINAHEPGVPGLVGVAVGVEGGEGVALSVAYPRGRRLDEADEASPRVHAGDLDLTVKLRRSGDWSGRPMLVVRFQPCTDAACLEAMAVELDVAIDPG
ncbi:MAG: thioredoxin domain-containing protein [Phycisphaerales bacterium]|nr:thioredoxin domain-containing protein [Phycisphaerales bacterium]